MGVKRVYAEQEVNCVLPGRGFLVSFIVTVFFIVVIFIISGLLL